MAVAMTTSEQISAHLPYLRRFARAISGSQKSGDAFVRQLLESLLADRENLPDDLSRAWLFRSFIKIWQVVGSPDPLPDSSQQQHPREQAATAKLQQVTGVNRLALMLTLIEGFSLEETAEILDVPPQTVPELIDGAHRELDGIVRTSVLIIEDEPIIALDLEDLVTGIGHEVVGNATTHSEAVAMASEKKPGLVLADIQLADGSSGIDAVNEILSQFTVPVVFITAYPERLLTGSRPEPAFLITKPFNTDAVKLAIGQALFFAQSSDEKDAA